MGRQEESMGVILKCNGRCMELKLNRNNNYTYAFPGKSENAAPMFSPATSLEETVVTGE